MLHDNLIYDFGLHRGEDSDFYLKKGYKVIAFEANPALVELCKRRFADPIAANRLTIIEGAIAPKSVGDSIPFFVNDRHSVWGTVSKNWADRNDHLGASCTEIKVARVDVDEVYRTFGVPFYLKIDVEGVDRLVVEALRPLSDKPRHLSMEAEKADFDALVADFDLLRELGYAKFKTVQQATIPGRKIIAKTRGGDAFEHVFAKDASGPFGDDIQQPWLSYDKTLRLHRRIFRRYRLFGDQSSFTTSKIGRMATIAVRRITGKPLVGWYDVHASL